MFAPANVGLASRAKPIQYFSQLSRRLKETPPSLHHQLLILSFQLQPVITIRLSILRRSIPQFILKPQVITNLFINLPQTQTTRNSKHPSARALRKFLQSFPSRIAPRSMPRRTAAQIVKHAVEDGVNLHIPALCLFNRLRDRPAASIIPAIAQDHHSLPPRLIGKCILSHQKHRIVQQRPLRRVPPRPHTRQSKMQRIRRVRHALQLQNAAIELHQHSAILSPAQHTLEENIASQRFVTNESLLATAGINHERQTQGKLGPASAILDRLFLAILFEDEVIFRKPFLRLSILAFHHRGDPDQPSRHLQRSHRLFVLIRRSSLSPSSSEQNQKAENSRRLSDHVRHMQRKFRLPR
jgi:hypothetical protein